jgi:ABC-type transport system substrate-binding protein
MFYKSEKTDELIGRAAAEVDPDKRMELARQVQETIMEDAPWVPLYVYPQITALRKDVHGLRVMPTELLIFNEVWKE